MSRALRFVLVGFIIVANGCATYVYQGEIRAKDSRGVERQTQLYWTRTDPLIGRAKAGPAILRTACGTPVTYVEQPDSIVFRGVPGQDRMVGQSASVRPGDVCGRFVGHKRFIDIGAGALQLTIRCVPLTDEFSVARAYLQARPAPYTFPVHEEKRWSLLGTVPNAPPPPPCR